MNYAENKINDLQQEKEIMKQFYKDQIIKLVDEMSNLKKNNGISLRDHFAGLAMQGLISDSDYRHQAGSFDLCEMSYYYADQMLELRL